LASSSKPADKRETSGFPWLGKPEQRPKQLFFVSFDIIDSTKLKTDLQKEGRSNSVWAKPFADFLSEAAVIFQASFSKKVEQCPNSGCEELCSEAGSKHPGIALWKYVGDEVILTAELQCRHQPHLLVHAVREAVAELNTHYTILDRTLEFKATMWVAGFPYANIELSMPGQDNTFLKDYLGPSIDLGFRLTKYSTKSRIVLSASLVYLLQKYNSEAEPPVTVYSGGHVQLKGVKKGEHPLFWTVPEGVEHKEGEEFLVPQSHYNTLRSFFKQYYKENNEKPFILAENPPPGYIKIYEKAVDEQKKIRGSVFYTGDEQTKSAGKGLPPVSGQERQDDLLKVLADLVKIFQKHPNGGSQ